MSNCSTVADSPSGYSFSRSVTHRFRNNCSIAVRSGLLMESSSIWSIYLYLLFSHFQNNHYYSLNRYMYIHVEGAGPRHDMPHRFHFCCRGEKKTDSSGVRPACGEVWRGRKEPLFSLQMSRTGWSLFKSPSDRLTTWGHDMILL